MVGCDVWAECLMSVIVWKNDVGQSSETKCAVLVCETMTFAVFTPKDVRNSKVSVSACNA